MEKYLDVYNNNNNNNIYIAGCTGQYSVLQRYHAYGTCNNCIQGGKNEEETVSSTNVFNNNHFQGIPQGLCSVCKSYFFLLLLNIK